MIKKLFLFLSILTYSYSGSIPCGCPVGKYEDKGFGFSYERCYSSPPPKVFCYSGTPVYHMEHHWISSGKCGLLEGYYVFCKPCSNIDFSFPQKDSNFTYSGSWKKNDNNLTLYRENCSKDDGTIESAKLTCVDYERCKIPACDQNNTNFPPKATNQIVIDEWKGQDLNKSKICEDNNYTTQERLVSCENEHRCLAPTQAPPIECNEDISSYISPSNRSFQEDVQFGGVP